MFLSCLTRTVQALLCLALLAATACRTPPKADPESNIAAALMDETLVPGDVLSISFIGTPSMNTTQKIQPDGRITMPMIGDVRAAGKRPAALQKELMGLYAPKLTNNELMVAVASTTVPIYVMGAVGRPGKVVLDRPLTLLEAIMEAGGLARGLADPKRIKIIRQVGGKHQTFMVNLAPAMRGQPTKPIYVQRYDMIIVPETWL